MKKLRQDKRPTDEKLIEFPLRMEPSYGERSSEERLDRDDPYTRQIPEDRLSPISEMDFLSNIKRLTKGFNASQQTEAIRALKAIRDGQPAQNEAQETGAEAHWPEPRALPPKAPELYKGKKKSGDLIEFLKRVYGPTGPDHPERPNDPGWLDGVSMSVAELRKLDANAANYWAQLSDKEKRAIELPTYGVAKDRRDPEALVRLRAQWRTSKQRSRSPANS